MDRKRFAMTLVSVMAVGAVTCTNGAHLRIALEDAGDPAPKRIEAGVQLASLCLSFALSWSRDRAMPAPRVRF